MRGRSPNLQQICLHFLPMSLSFLTHKVFTLMCNVHLHGTTRIGKGHNSGQIKFIPLLLLLLLLHCPSSSFDRDDAPLLKQEVFRKQRVWGWSGGGHLLYLASTKRTFLALVSR